MKGIITLCGSTRFWPQWNEVSGELTLADWIVLGIGYFHNSDIDPEIRDKVLAKKDALDRLHKEKIAISQAIVVINKDGYVGDSTKSEVAYARKIGKAIYWYEPDRYNLMKSSSDVSWKRLLEPQSAKEKVSKMKRIAHLVGDTPIQCLDTETFQDPIISIEGNVLTRRFTQLPHGLVYERDLHYSPPDCWCKTLNGGRCPYERREIGRE